MKSIFEMYLEEENDVWTVRGCSSEQCDSFVSDKLFLSRWQAGSKKSSYVELQCHVEVYNCVCILLVCSGIVCVRDFYYVILWLTLQADLNRVP